MNEKSNACSDPVGPEREVELLKQARRGQERLTAGSAFMYSGHTLQAEKRIATLMTIERSKYSIRRARKSECRRIAELYRISSDGVADYIWTKLAAPGEDSLDVGRRRYERAGTLFSYENCKMVELQGSVVGMLVAFPMRVDEKYEETDPILLPYSVLEEDQSYYICGMAVDEKCRGKGIGTGLLEEAEQTCHGCGLEKLSLIVFEQNAKARRLYERHGYVETRRHPVVPHPLIHYTGDALLMVKNVGRA